MNGKFGLDHLTSLKGIKARLHLGQLMEYQKWVDEQSDLVDAIMSMYQVQTSPENADVEEEDKEGHMSWWIHSLTM